MPVRATKFFKINRRQFQASGAFDPWLDVDSPLFVDPTLLEACTIPEFAGTRDLDLEYLLAHRGRQGQRFTYELVYEGENADGRARLLGLLDPARLQPVHETSRGEAPNFAGDARGDGGGVAGALPVVETLCG